VQDLDQLGLSPGQPAGLDQLLDAGAAMSQADGLVVRLLDRLAQRELVLALGEPAQLVLKAADHLAHSARAVADPLQVALQRLEHTLLSCDLLPQPADVPPRQPQGQGREEHEQGQEPDRVHRGYTRGVATPLSVSLSALNRRLRSTRINRRSP